jgi:hypothetical protein
MSCQNENPRTVSSSCHASFFSRPTLGLCILVASQLALMPQSTTAFAVPHMKQQRSLQLRAISNQDDEITKQVERARELLRKTKAKIEAKEQEELDALNGDNGATNGSVPFFASKDVVQNNKKEKVTKTQNEEGLITTDGEMMAQLSETEEWEVRSLLECFENEKEDTKADYFANRDVSASIYNLRKTLQLKDFQRIFDSKNFFIGDN